MRIITYQAFQNEINIADTETTPVQNSLNGFIDKYTKKFLKQLYGDAMGQLFIDALPTLDNTSRFWELAQNTDLQAALAAYVYYWYQRNNVSFSSSQGEKRAKAANSEDTQVNYKVSRAWNEDLVPFVRSNTVDTTVFPEYVPYQWYWSGRGFNYCNEFAPVKREIYYTINPLF